MFQWNLCCPSELHWNMKHHLTTALPPPAEAVNPLHMCHNAAACLLFNQSITHIMHSSLPSTGFLPFIAALSSPDTKLLLAEGTALEQVHSPVSSEWGLGGEVSDPLQNCLQKIQKPSNPSWNWTPPDGHRWTPHLNMAIRLDEALLLLMSY